MFVCWKLNLSPPQVHRALLDDELPLQPPGFLFIYLFLLFKYQLKTPNISIYPLWGILHIVFLRIMTTLRSLSLGQTDKETHVRKWNVT